MDEGRGQRFIHSRGREGPDGPALSGPEPGVLTSVSHGSPGGQEQLPSCTWAPPAWLRPNPHILPPKQTEKRLKRWENHIPRIPPAS